MNAKPELEAESLDIESHSRSENFRPLSWVYAVFWICYVSVGIYHHSLLDRSDPRAYTEADRLVEAQNVFLFTGLLIFPALSALSAVMHSIVGDHWSNTYRIVRVFAFFIATLIATLVNPFIYTA